MARSYDIADLMTSDGEYITDSVRRKINGNFRRICQMMQKELPSQQQQQIASAVTGIVNGILDNALPEMRDELLDQLAPVGSVIVTYTSSDPRLSHGTWEQVGSGRYIRAAGSGVAVGDEGGSSEAEIAEANLPLLEHTVEVASAGAHTHNMGRALIDYGSWHDASSQPKSLPATGAGHNNTPFDLGQYGGSTGSTWGIGVHTHTVTIEPHGSEEPEPVAIEPEYVALLFYRRTA